jgi:hypothetical protein
MDQYKVENDFTKVKQIFTKGNKNSLKRNKYILSGTNIH